MFFKKLALQRESISRSINLLYLIRSSEIGNSLPLPFYSIRTRSVHINSKWKKPARFFPGISSYSSTLRENIRRKDYFISLHSHSPSLIKRDQQQTWIQNANNNSKRYFHFSSNSVNLNNNKKINKITMTSNISEISTTSPDHDHNDITILISEFDKIKPVNRRTLSTIQDSFEYDIHPETNSVGSGSDESIREEANIYDLLEKVIKFKGRHISHITIENSVKLLCSAYNLLEDSEKYKFFMTIAEKYSIDSSNVFNIASNLTQTKDDNARYNVQEKLKSSLIPEYQWFFTQIGRLENGVKFLVDFRTDLLEILEQHKESSLPLRALNNSLRDLIEMWFAIGFLNLERVTWKSSCDMLQKISEYEAVHSIRNWTDLKRRVGNYRRCFVFTHGSMPGEPVVILHTALTNHIISNIRSIVVNPRMMSVDSNTDSSSLGEDAEFINTAIFYSITSTQKGLSGIELGNYLIKRVVKELKSEFPKMSQFSSLSPIPGYRLWLMNEFKSAQKDSSKILFTIQEQEIIGKLLDIDPNDKQKFYDKLLKLFHLNEWYTDDKLSREMETPLIRLCCRYLVLEKRRGYAINGVAHFHLKNGAVLWRLNWKGDTSPRGLSQSCSIMINYRYFLENCEKNSQNYLENQNIELSDQVRLLSRMAISASGEAQQSKI